LVREERQVQSLFFDSHAAWAYGICLRYLADNFRAEEAVQDGFVKIFKSIHTYDASKAQLKTWMSSIFINVCLDKLRLKSQNFQDSFVDLNELIETGIDIGEYSDSEVFALITHMPEGYRSVFNLYAIEGYNHNEISKKLNIKSSTSRSQYYRAKLWLKQNLPNSKLFKNEKRRLKTKI